MLITTAAVEKEGANASARARALYERAIIFDANLEPPFADWPYPLEAAAIVRKSGVNCAKLSLGGTNCRYDNVVAEVAWVQRFIEASPDVFMQIRDARDFARAKEEKRFGILFSFESTEMLGGKPERIELFRNLGVRVMQLSYNETSPFGAGVLADRTLPLTKDGRKAIENMNQVGVALDLSHAGPTTMKDAIAVSTKPVLLTHTGCVAIHQHPRNKTDEQLKAVADKGGVVGIYVLPYLTPSPQQPHLDDYMAHMCHALNVCGEDHVGIGSDSVMSPFDTSPEAMAEFNKERERRKATGVAAPEEDRPLYVEGLNHPRRCETIADALLTRGYSERIAEKVLGLNFVNALTEIWK
jgi:membrane dipeptidase